MFSQQKPAHKCFMGFQGRKEQAGGGGKREKGCTCSAGNILK